jgi:hypothetical protein
MTQSRRYDDVPNDFIGESKRGLRRPLVEIPKYLAVDYTTARNTIFGLISPAATPGWLGSVQRLASRRQEVPASLVAMTVHPVRT